MRHLPAIITAPGRGRRLLTIALFLAWVLVVARVAGSLPTQAASWLTFIALLITPGYFLADLITWRLKLDWLEQLALAMPLGVAILAVPGTIALVQHLTLDQLTSGWIIASALVFLAWLVHGIWLRSFFRQFDSSRYPGRDRWAIDEIILLLLLAAAFVLILPTLNLNKIDGDAYAVATFTADALAGLPLNKVEPIFGTDLGPGVRMIFNQFLSLSYLWSYLSGVDAITLTAMASRSMLALWALFATYALGKAAGENRRFGLFVASVQMLIYLAAPFVRGDNVALFFFERTNADKFMVPITMLPVVFAFAIRYVRSGRVANWAAAAVATFAVSTIHPLIAAMLALAIAAFGAFHLLLNLRHKRAWQRTMALAGLVVIVMLLPAAQLVISRGEAPLADSYPSSFEGWPLGKKQIPLFPFIQIETVDLYGPQPELSRLEASEANTTTDPFLLWRFDVNMDRRRIILFDLNHYISDPSIILEPPYLLAFLLLPLAIWRRRNDIGAQFAVATALAILLVMFNPILTPLIGSLVMPWILWRFVWLLPYALIIALVLRRLLTEWGPALLRRLRLARAASDSRLPAGAYALSGSVILAALLLAPRIQQNLHNLNDRAVSPYFFPNPPGLLDRLNQITRQSGPVTVLADSDLSVTIPAYVANAAIIAHRAPTTSEVFPANQQDVALQRLIDQDHFYRTPYLTEEAVAILQRYQVDYVTVASGSDLDMQLRLAPAWFTWITDDQSYSLYAVNQMPTVTAAIAGNSSMVQRRWSDAEASFQAALAQNPNDLLALVGLAEIAHARGQFDTALNWLQQAAALVDLPILHYQMGRIYTESGQFAGGIDQLEIAQAVAPNVSRFHAALGDACLAAGDLPCAQAQYSVAAANQNLPDEASRLIAEGDLWRQQDRVDVALSFYETAAAQQPSDYNLFLLESAYREAGQFDKAEALLAELRQLHPFSAEVLVVEASLLAAQDKIDEAASRYRQAIWLQDFLAEESTATHLALAQLLLSANRLEDARQELELVLVMQPFNPAAHRTQGDLYQQQEQYEQAALAYERAFQLDPTQIDTYIALNNQLQQHGGQPAGITTLLQETIEANPDEALLFLALGDQLQSSGDPAGAIDAFQAALDRLDLYGNTQTRGPSRPNAESRAFVYARLARVYEDQREIEPALNYYRAAVAAAPDTPWTHVLLGDALRRDNDGKAAETAYLQAIASDAGYVDAYVGLGELYIDTGRYDEASELLQMALSEAADSTDPYMRLADLEQRRGRYDDALVWLRQAAEVAMNSRTVNTPLIDALVRYGDYDTALAYVQEALVVRPSDGDLMLRMGQLQLTLGQFAGAESALLKARRLMPDNSRVYDELAALYVTEGQPRAAIGVYEQAIRIQPAEAGHYLGLSQLWLGQGEYDQALTVLKNALPLVSRPGDIFIALSTLYAQQGELALAEETLVQGIAQVGESTPLLLALGRHYLSRADYTTAQAQFKRVLELHNDEAAAYAALGDLYLRRSDTTNAIVQYQLALALEPDNPSYHLNLGDAYAAATRPDEAQAAYNEALTLLPTLENVYISLANFYEAQEKWAEAEATYQRGLVMAPTSGRIYIQYANLLMAQERPAEAVALLDTAVQRLPTASSFIARATLFTQTGQTDAAIQDLQRALTQSPGSIDALVALGDLYRQQDNVTEAEKVYQSVVNLMPGVPIGYLRLGALAGAQGDLEAAQRYADIARAIEPQIARPDDVAQ